MQRNRSNRTAAKKSTTSQKNTRVVSTRSASAASAVKTLSMTNSRVHTSATATPSRVVRTAPSATKTVVKSASSGSPAMVARRTFSTDTEATAPTRGYANRRQNFQQAPRFFKPEHADNNAVNSVPKFGRAQLSKPFPPLRQKVVNPDLTVTDFTHNDINSGWHVLVSYPKDFTFVCPSELNELADRVDEFKSINTKVWGLSCDSENVHVAWMSTPRKQGGIEGITFPLIADVNRLVTSSIGALLPENFGTRATLIYGDGKLRHASFNEPPVGRSVDEILRLVRAFQYFDENGEVCPARWKKPGDPTMIPTKEGSRSYFEQEQ